MPAAEIFPGVPVLLYLKYRTALNFCFVLVTAVWIAWCLCWPFVARHQDIQRSVAEATATYEVCLQQRGVTAGDCRHDQQVYRQLLSNAVAPPDENAYQVFAGKKIGDAIRFMSVLCLLPPVVAFALVRLTLEFALVLARLRSADVRTPPLRG